MIFGIDPRINPDILYALASMGHGDSLVIADANFPSHSIAETTIWGQSLQWSVDAITALKLTLSVIPIDPYDPESPPVLGMQVVGAPNDIPKVIAASKPILSEKEADITLIERFSFYESASNAFVILRTVESLPYGNFIIRKGVIL